MQHRRSLQPCGFPEEALIASALDEADAVLDQAVRTHIHQCQACQRLYASYCSLQPLFSKLQDAEVAEEPLRQARDNLSRLLAPSPVTRLRYRFFASALGVLCIVKSEQGIPLLTWQAQAPPLLSTLKGQQDLEVCEDGEELQNLITELQAYFTGAREGLAWPIDERFVRSPFQRQVLNVTAAIPYGAVMSYQGVAAAIGQPKAVRAVAQALRRNPLAIVIPCHRVVGQSGHLTGYAGGLETKRALLAHEGVPLLVRPHGAFVDKAHMYVGWRASRSYCQPHCPSLAEITPDDTLLLSPQAVSAQTAFSPCDVCHPEVKPA
jgi:methylated-DNA-[protein]-cysteine S-methyltransferase